MANENDEKEPLKEAEAEGEALPEVEGGDALAKAPEPAEEQTAAQLGSRRYVHAAFFFAGILLAFLSGKILALAWHNLADWPAAVRAVPQLVSYPEDERESFTLAIGAVIGTLAIIQVYRREKIRHWADEVATELTKVTWPNRETVVNGTLVVVIATTIATVYVAVLDRFWGFLTNLVYGT
jgi:preprotein translocase subunit SecE